MEENINETIELETRFEPVAIVEDKITDIPNPDIVYEDSTGYIALLYTEEEVKATIHLMAEEIKKRFKDKEDIVFLEVLNGAKPLADQLKIELNIQPPFSGDDEDCFYAETDTIHPSSYRNGMEQGDLIIKKDMTIDPKGKNIIIVEDVIDSYKTMINLINLLKERGAKSVTVVVLCNKREKEDADITGFMFDASNWGVGCGMGTKVEGQEDEIYRDINNEKYALGVFVPNVRK